jgi:hypothetical protein
VGSENRSALHPSWPALQPGMRITFSNGDKATIISNDGYEAVYQLDRWPQFKQRLWRIWNWRAIRRLARNTGAKP